MAILPIVTGADTPVLRKKTVKVPHVTKEVKKLIRDMRDTVEKKGVGLAGPQVGSSLRICLASINGKMTALINPLIVRKSDQTNVDEEGCLSLPGIWLNIRRATEIDLVYTDENGATQERHLTGFDARVVQHETDHLDGVLIVDYRDSTSTEHSSMLSAGA